MVFWLVFDSGPAGLKKVKLARDVISRSHVSFVAPVEVWIDARPSCCELIHEVCVACQTVVLWARFLLHASLQRSKLVPMCYYMQASCCVSMRIL